jgi:hypothetical protein
MSAYVVADDCINSIVTWLTFPRHEWERRQVEEALSQQGTIGDTFEQRLGNAMFELNCNAVEQRYGDGQAKEFRDLDYAWKANYHASGYGVYDRLGEYLYQCSEGDVPESNKLYQALDRVYNQLAHTFFRELKDRDCSDRAELRQRIDVLERKLQGRA